MLTYENDANHQDASKKIIFDLFSVNELDIFFSGKKGGNQFYSHCTNHKIFEQTSAVTVTDCGAVLHFLNQTYECY